jgi:hypothetical protein
VQLQSEAELISSEAWYEISAPIDLRHSRPLTRAESSAVGGGCVS